MTLGYFGGYSTAYATPYFPGASSQAPPIVFSNELANYLRANLINPYPLKAPQSPTGYPRMTFTLVDGDDDLLLSGPSGLSSRRYQIDCHSTSYAEAEGLAERLRLLLRGFRGAMGRVYVANCNRHPIAASISDPPNRADSSAVSKFMSEFTFWFYS